MNGLIGLILFGLAIAVAVLAVIFIVVPLIKGLIWLISNFFRGIGWLIQHIFGYIFGTIGDVIRFVGSVLAMVVLAPMVPLNVIVGRWSAAGHFGESIKRESKVAALCVYRVCLQRPLKLLLLHGLLEGIEQRVPEAMAAAPISDRPSRRTGTFDGYTIVGSLRGGGSGGKLYIAEPNRTGRTARRDMPERVVIKSFALTDGSSLPQIVRESRALEAARKLGLVLDHSMTNERFWYVMPYHSGENLGIVARQLHAESSERGLTEPQLRRCMTYVSDLLGTISQYHRGGLWHKDIKPENVIINREGAHLVDLGLVTPLRSAMTLTTHGTEYFRDPEMVRMALRGVKVHQVDGAKFDIFALGAVLYFVLENTFPAHGALSRFTRRSPEALRWVVRRAMADYNKRYDNVDQIAADLETIMRASDPFAVKPADLPSMRGGAPPRGIGDLELDDDHAGAAVASIESAGSPKPAGARSVGFAAGIDGKGPFARFGRVEFDEEGDAVREPRTRSAPRPRLKVTNWWTGRYAVDFAQTAEAGRVSLTPAIDELRRQARDSARHARRAARDQLRAARTRAREMRKRATEHRVRASAERQPSLSVILTTLIVLSGVALIVFSIMSGSRGGSTAWIGDSVSAAPPARTDGPPLLVLNDVREPDHEAAQRRVDRIVESWRNRGYDVVTDDAEAEAAIRPLYANWRDDPYGDADEAIEDGLEQHNYYGILHITQDEDARWPGAGISDQSVYSEREGAKQRRRSREDILASAAKPLLIINDHPDRDSSFVRKAVDQHAARRINEGYTVVADDPTVSGALKPLLRQYRGEHDPQTESLVRTVLASSGYSAVQYFTAAEGDSRVEPLFIDAAASDGDAGSATATTSDTTITLGDDGPLLLINDHAAKADPEVEQAIRTLLEALEQAGVRVIVDDNVEIDVRRLLPPGAIDALDNLPATVQATLKEHGLDGILRVLARPGDEKPEQRITIEHLRVEDEQTVSPSASNGTAWKN